MHLCIINENNLLLQLNQFSLNFALQLPIMQDATPPRAQPFLKEIAGLAMVGNMIDDSSTTTMDHIF